MSIPQDSGQKPVPQPSWWWSLPWLTIAASSLTSLTVGLTLLGYGFDYGYLDAFGLRPQELQRTPLEFLMRSDQPMLLFIQFANEIQNKFLDQPWIPIWWETWMFVLSTAALASGIAYLWGTRGRRALKRAAQVIGENTWVQHAVKSPRLARIRASTDTRDRLLGYGLPVVWASVVMAVFHLLLALEWAICFLVIVLVIALPVSPVKGAREMALREVIRPLGCRPLRERGLAEQVRARCVRIVRDGCEVARGRYIEQSANRVWLFSKAPWRVMSVPLDQSVMEDTPSETPSAHARVGTGCDPHSKQRAEAE